MFCLDDGKISGYAACFLGLMLCFPSYLTTTDSRVGYDGEALKTLLMVVSGVWGSVVYIAEVSSLWGDWGYDHAGGFYDGWVYD